MATQRMAPNAGIAIGPILFIIAILAILAAAIAAGSGSFTSGTNNESNRTKSSALIQIGENLKIGMDRITMEAGLTPAQVDINVQNTAATNALFSPVGGGIAPPSVGMANDPTTDKWWFPQGPIKGLGTGANNVIAVLPVSSGVCAEVNNRVVGSAVAPATEPLGNFLAGTLTGATSWPTVPPLVGVATGCVQNSDVSIGSGASTQYFYYQVLAIQ
jgi:hypothetical protein